MSYLYSKRCACCKKDFRTRQGGDQLCEDCAAYFQGIMISQDHIVQNETSAREELTKDLAIHKKALEILGRKAQGCPAIAKADTCSDFFKQGVCHKCRIDTALQQAREQEEPTP